MLDYDLVFYERILVALEKVKVQYLEELSYGTAESYADYKKLCGTVFGLDQAVNVVKSTAIQLKKEID